MQEIQETQVPSLGQEDPLEKAMATYSSILAWKKAHGQRSLEGYSPRGLKELDTTKQLTTTQECLQRVLSRREPCQTCTLRAGRGRENGQEAHMRNHLGRPGLELPVVAEGALDGAGVAGQGDNQAGPWFSHKVGRRGNGEDGSVQTRSQSELPCACRYCSRRALDGSKRQGYAGCGNWGIAVSPGLEWAMGSVYGAWEQPLSGDKVCYLD